MGLLQVVLDDGQVLAGSRNRWITPESAESIGRCLGNLMVPR